MNNTNLSEKHNPNSVNEVIDSLDSMNFFDDSLSQISNDTYSEVSQICSTENTAFYKRYNLVDSHIQWDYSNKDSFQKSVSLLLLFWITDLESFNWINIEELGFQLREWNFSILEELYLLKMESIFNEKNQELWMKLLLELNTITFAVIQMLWVVSMNSLKKNNVLAWIRKMKIYFHKLFKELSIRKTFSDNVKISGIKDEIDFNLEFASVSYDSEINFSWMNSKKTVTDIYEKKSKKIKNINNSLLEDKSNDYDLLKKQILMKATLLNVRLELQYNEFQQEAYFETKCKHDKKQYNITDLKELHNLCIFTLVALYSDRVWCEFDNNYNKNNKDSYSVEDQSEFSRDFIQWVLDHFILQLQNNHQEIGFLFNIIESILYYSDCVDKKMLIEFQDNINSKLNRNNRFVQGDISILNISTEALFDYKYNFLKQQKESKIDPLTWLNNRGAFDSDFPKLLSKSTRLPETYHGILILDIDFFKKINDNYGHVWGDVILWLLAKVVSDNIRPWTDSIYRVWWEEFAILFEVKDEDWALKFTDKIRRKISEEVIKWVEWPDISSWVKDRLKGLKELTVSIWYTQIISDKKNMSDEEIEELLTELYQQADLALYDSKENGRNKSTKYTKRLDK